MRHGAFGMVARTKAAYSLAELASSCLSVASAEPLEELRRALRGLTGQEFVLPTASGRGALYLLLRSLGPRRVVIPGFTCSAVPEAVIRAGGTPVTVDVEAGGFNVDADRLEEVLHPGDVLVATHQYGIPCAIAEMAELARRRGAMLIEDVAAALGTRVDGRPVGTFGDASFYSFDTTKLVNVATKAGFLTVQDPDWFRRIEAVYERETSMPGPGRRLADLARGVALKLIEPPAAYRLFHLLWFDLRGRATEETGRISCARDRRFDGRMTPEQATQALRQIAELPRIVERRRSLYGALRKMLAGARTFVLPPEDVRSEWACIRFPILVPGGKQDFYRAAVRLGVDFAFSFTSIWCSEDCRESRRRASEVLDLPFYGGLGERELAKVVDVLRTLDLRGGGACSRT